MSDSEDVQFLKNRIYNLENKVNLLMVMFDSLTFAMSNPSHMACGQCGITPYDGYVCSNSDCMNGFYVSEKKGE